jgi:hypothetical protein
MMFVRCCVQWDAYVPLYGGDDSMALPNLTPEQRQAALAKAALARRDRAELLAAVKSGQTSLAEVFDRADDLAKRTRVVQVLRAVPGYGPAKVAALMAVCGVEEKRRVGGLGEQQRRRLLESFTG